MCSPSEQYDYISTVFLHYTNIFVASTRTTTSNQASPRSTWLIQLVTAHPVPPAMVCFWVPLKLIWIFVLFMFSFVLIMNTSTCHAITFSLIYIINYLLNYEIKICHEMPRFLTTMLPSKSPLITTHKKLLLSSCMHTKTNKIVEIISCVQNCLDLKK
jgi:hypothetical protein